jgi:ADP-L-glycero-D-manno-heptose 6-epimerase
MKKEQMIVVTGASGMIGSGVVRHLNDLGYSNLLLVDDLKRGEKWKNLLGKQFKDLISKHALMNWLQGKEDEIDAIIHLGACSDTIEADADYLMENNYRYTIRLAEWAINWNKRFIYASSAATYGDGALGFEDDEAALEELLPLNMYGFSKHLADLWMKREGFLNRVVGLKYFNVFGPNEYHKGRMASMVMKMMEKCADGSRVHLFKTNDPKFVDGGQMRDFIYVKDAVKITCAFLDPKYRSAAGIFNVGQGIPTTWNQLAEAFFKALQKPVNIGYIDMPEDLAKQYQNYTCACMSKLHKIFFSDPKYVETTSIEEAVGEYVQKYLIKKSRW